MTIDQLPLPGIPVDPEFEVGWVYCLTDNIKPDCVKIGHSTVLDQREIKLHGRMLWWRVGTKADEQRLQYKFRAERFRDTEWFLLSGRMELYFDLQVIRQFERSFIVSLHRLPPLPSHGSIGRLSSQPPME